VEYRGKTALVTGASSGIGTAFAEALAGRGCDLVLVARSAGALAVLAQRLRSEHGVRVETLAQDLTAPGAAQAVQQETDRLGLGVNILVNNAGFGSVGRFDTIAAQRSAREVALDVAAVVELAHAFLPSMAGRGEGAVVNVASTAAFQPVPYMSVYGASKAFVFSFSQALWAEYRSLGVRVLALCPGPVDTNFFAVAGTREVGKRAAVGRPKTPEAVVRAALRALDRNRFMVTPGLANAALPALNRLLPRHLLLAVAERLYRDVQGTAEPGPVPLPTVPQSHPSP
jgi:short-subunit dehydrogenase